MRRPDGLRRRAPRVMVLASVLGAALTLLVVGTPLRAQPVALQQDSTLDNLAHPVTYVTAPLGTLGGVVRRGTGHVDVVLIPGWGFGAEVFDAFMRDNATR